MANTPEQTTTDSAQQPQTAPVVDKEALKAQLREELEAELKAERDALEADKEVFKAEQESAEATKVREAKRSTYKLPAEDKKILDALKEDSKTGKRKNADQVSGALNVDAERVIQVAYENMNGESVYELASRLGVKVNDVYKATGQDDMVRYQESEDESGNRVREEFDYEAK